MPEVFEHRNKSRDEVQKLSPATVNTKYGKREGLEVKEIIRIILQEYP